MRKGRKIEGKPPPVTGCRFLDGVMPQTVQFYLNRYNNNVLMTIVPESLDVREIRKWDSVGEAVKYTSQLSFYLDQLDKKTHNYYRLFVESAQFGDYFSYKEKLLEYLKDHKRKGPPNITVHVILIVPDEVLVTYAETGIIPEQFTKLWSFAQQGFIYNPIRQVYECQHSTTVPSLKHYYYPASITECV